MTEALATQEHDSYGYVASLRSYSGDERNAARRALAAVLTTFDHRLVLIELGSILWLDAIQCYPTQGEVPAIIADTINLAFKYALPAERTS